MPQVGKLIGAPGSGKTHTLIHEKMRNMRDAGVSWRDVGFVSFTRAAREEAAARASEMFGVPPDVLESEGWFRTLHSVCYRMLQVYSEQMLTDNSASAKWISDALGVDYEPPQSSDDGMASGFDMFSDEGASLNLWDTARNKMLPLGEQYAIASMTGDDLPAYERVIDVVEAYESSKRRDNKFDFTDLLAKFVGIEFSESGEEPKRIQPTAPVPGNTVWFLDEAQDLSNLTAAAFDRIIKSPHVRWVVIAGDPFQAIYEFAGARPGWLLEYPADKTDIMKKSYRCASPILSLGESIISDTDGYFDRHVAPADHEGFVEDVGTDSFQQVMDSPRDPWLVLARTNKQWAYHGSQLTSAGIPWKPLRGTHGGFSAPATMEALTGIHCLLDLGFIHGNTWRRIVGIFPAKIPDGPLFERGTKARFKKSGDWEREFPRIGFSNLRDLGATDQLIQELKTGNWRDHLLKGKDLAAGIQLHGVDLCMDPQIRVGTIHSAKGQEAENVYLDTASTPRIASAPDQSENRVAYVGVTRAKSRLVLSNPKGTWYKIPV